MWLHKRIYATFNFSTVYMNTFKGWVHPKGKVVFFKSIKHFLELHGQSAFLQYGIVKVENIKNQTTNIISESEVIVLTSQSICIGCQSAFSMLTSSSHPRLGAAWETVLNHLSSSQNIHCSHWAKSMSMNPAWIWCPGSCRSLFKLIWTFFFFFYVLILVLHVQLLRRILQYTVYSTV